MEFHIDPFFFSDDSFMTSCPTNIFLGVERSRSKVQICPIGDNKIIYQDGVMFHKCDNQSQKKKKLIQKADDLTRNQTLRKMPGPVRYQIEMKQEANNRLVHGSALKRTWVVLV